MFLSEAPFTRSNDSLDFVFTYSHKELTGENEKRGELCETIEKKKRCFSAFHSIKLTFYIDNTKEQSPQSRVSHKT